MPLPKTPLLLYTLPAILVSMLKALYAVLNFGLFFRLFDPNKRLSHYKMEVLPLHLQDHIHALAFKAEVDDIVKTLHDKHKIKLRRFGVVWCKDDEYYDWDYNTIKECMSVIPRYIAQRKTINKRNSSYGLKHFFEEQLPHQYIANGEFIVAMLLLGYKVKWIDGSPNCFFNWKALK